MKQYFPRVMLAWLLALSCWLTLGAALRFPAPQPEEISLLTTPFTAPVLILAGIAGWITVFHSRRTRLVSAAAALTLAFVWGLSVLGSGGYEDTAERFNRYIQWLNRYILEFSGFDAGYARLTELLLYAALSLAAVLLAVKFRTFWGVLALGFGIYIPQVILATHYSAGGYVLFMGVVGLALLMHTGKKEEARLMPFLWPVALIGIGLALVLPNNNRHVSLPHPVFTAESASRIINGLTPNNWFPDGLRLPGGIVIQPGFGFSDTTSLRARPGTDNRVLFLVEANRPMYLKADTKMVYTGDSWLRGDAVWEDTQRTLRELARTPEVPWHQSSRPELNPLVAEFMVSATLTITTVRASTRQLPVPWMAGEPRIHGRLQSATARNEHGDYLYERGLPAGSAYTVTGAALNPASSLFWTLRVSWANDPQVAVEFRGIDLSPALQLPDGLPQRVVDLAASITRGKYGPFEQALAIENYLSRNFTYTLAPPALPIGRDFVDFLLFDSQAGFCTHYATAMVVLCRAVGIPARLAEGYVMPSEPEEDGYYWITAMNRHAWVEILLPGVGWYGFEPTPPFASLFHSQGEPAAAAHIPAMVDWNYYDWEEEEDEDWMWNSGWMPPATVTPADEPEPSRWIEILTASWPYLAAAALLALMAGGIIWRRRYLTAASKIAAPKVVFTLYRRLRLLYFLRGMRPEAGETPGRFAARADASVGFKHHFTGMNMKGATTLYEAARYSPWGPSEPETADLIRFYESFMSYTRQKVGWFRFMRFWATAP
jgi:transglutaminase-like putative cysteine protease